MVCAYCRFAVVRRSSQPSRIGGQRSRLHRCSELWRNATAVTADPGWARGVASEARQGDALRQRRWSCATQGVGSRVRSVSELFLARISPLGRSSAAQMAPDASRPSGQAEAARWPMVVAGCSLGLRLCRSKSPDASLYPDRWRKPGCLASSARRIARGGSPAARLQMASLGHDGSRAGRKRVWQAIDRIRYLTAFDRLSPWRYPLPVGALCDLTLFWGAHGMVDQAEPFGSALWKLGRRPCGCFRST
jgi:hypothetical protein